MMERLLNVYTHSLVDKRITTPQRQAHCYVAAASAKRACELMGITTGDMARYGGLIQNKALQAFCRAEPEVVFAEVKHNVYVPLEHYGDKSQYRTIEIRDEELHGRETEHPSFGQIRVSRVSGQANLFMVDYPQDHFLELEISTARLNRAHGQDRVFSDDVVVKIALSEVQWARMIASPNTQGVPCTLRQYLHPKSGDFLAPILPERHAADTETFNAEVKQRATSAAEGVKEAQALLDQIMQGGPARKSDLSRLQELLRAANQQIVANLPYILETAHEAILNATDHAKAEVDAHIDYSLQRLGERALGARLQEAIAANVDIKQVGRAVSLALDDKTEDPE